MIYIYIIWFTVKEFLRGWFSKFGPHQVLATVTESSLSRIAKQIMIVRWSEQNTAISTLFHTLPIIFRKLSTETFIQVIFMPSPVKFLIIRAVSIVVEERPVQGSDRRKYAWSACGAWKHLASISAQVAVQEMVDAIEQKNQGCLGYIGGFTTQFCGYNNKPLEVFRGSHEDQPFDDRQQTASVFFNPMMQRVNNQSTGREQQTNSTHITVV